jgi:hypothetical protein
MPASIQFINLYLHYVEIHFQRDVLQIDVTP